MPLRWTPSINPAVAHHLIVRRLGINMQSAARLPSGPPRSEAFRRYALPHGVLRPDFHPGIGAPSPSPCPCAFSRRAAPDPFKLKHAQAELFFQPSFKNLARFHLLTLHSFGLSACGDRLGEFSGFHPAPDGFAADHHHRLKLVAPDYFVWFGHWLSLNCGQGMMGLTLNMRQ